MICFCIGGKGASFQQLSITVAAALSYAFHFNARRGRQPSESLADHAKVLEHIRMREPDAAYAALSGLLEEAASTFASSQAANIAKAKFPA